VQFACAYNVNEKKIIELNKTKNLLLMV